MVTQQELVDAGWVTFSHEVDPNKEYVIGLGNEPYEVFDSHLAVIFYGRSGRVEPRVVIGSSFRRLKANTLPELMQLRELLERE